MTVQQKNGSWGEDQAAAFLEARGMVILERNWRYKRAEIDIIGRDGEILVFIEVKTRTGVSFGKPEEMVGLRKKQLVIEAATAYMRQVHHDWEIRFDIVGITGEPGKPFDIEHFKDAYYPGYL